MRKIVLLVSSRRFSYILIANLGFTIRMYLELKAKIFEDDENRFKDHTMRHFPLYVRTLGPLIHYSTLQFESRHRYFKDAAKSASSTRNLTKTMAKSYQKYQNYLSLSNRMCQEISYTVSKNGKLTNTCYLTLFPHKLGKDTCLVQDLIFKGVVYKKRLYVISDVTDSAVEAAEIVDVVRSLGQFFLILSRKSLSYDQELAYLYCDSEESSTLVCWNIREVPDFDLDPTSSYLIRGRCYLSFRALF